jgi:hypothetical protein
VVDDLIFAHSDNGQLRQFQGGSLSLLKCIEAKGDGDSCS